MIHVRCEVVDGRTSITVEGHEEHAEEGRVCASLTAVARTAVLGLEQIALRHPNLVTFEMKE